MTAHTLTYPALQRRLISTRRSRTLFLSATTQRVRSRPAAAIEIVRALAALLALAAWSLSLLLIGG